MESQNQWAIPDTFTVSPINHNSSTADQLMDQLFYSSYTPSQDTTRQLVEILKYLFVQSKAQQLALDVLHSALHDATLKTSGVVNSLARVSDQVSTLRVEMDGTYVAIREIREEIDEACRLLDSLNNLPDVGAGRVAHG